MTTATANIETLSTKEVLDRIFKDPKVCYELAEFENLGKPIHDILKITSRTDAKGQKYYLKSFIPFSSGKEEVQVFTHDGKAAPEEIVRQLWVYKLINFYDYKADQIELETSVQFGTEVGTKAADIVVYIDSAKDTPKIIIEVKKPKRKDGIEQLKSYLNAKGSPVGVWSNGSDRLILYRPYPAKFDDTLSDIPRRDENPEAVLEKKRTLTSLDRDFNFKKIIQDLEELVLADSGKDEFNEIFKLIFAKIWDEKEAVDRKDKVVEFQKSKDPEITYTRINTLFRRACEEWEGIFEETDKIELLKEHLQVCIGPLERVRLMGSNLRIMDDAFEYLLPTEAKKKKGQFFTPRHVVEMCVRMLNPKQNETVMDPSCGSAGFLLHAMDWCYPADSSDKREVRKHKYASQKLWGIDFETRAAKTSRALMLIAGDGHSNIFGPDVNSLDPRTWFSTGSGMKLIQALRDAKLTAKKVPANEPLRDDEVAWEYFDELKFDLVLANPPFAGEVKEKHRLVHYELARRALARAKDKQAKEERDVLFIERIIKWLRPGGRAAIVLPQGKFNNSSLAFIREWILRKARLLAVVGLHGNTFKPHTGTKTSVLFIQKYTQDEIDKINDVKAEVEASCPDYEATIKTLTEKYADAVDVPEDEVPEEVLELLLEEFQEPEPETSEDGDVQSVREDAGSEPLGLVAESSTPYSRDDRIADADERIIDLRRALVKAKQRIGDLAAEWEAVEEKTEQELVALTDTWNGTKADLNAEKKKLKDATKARVKELKATSRDREKKLRAEIKALEKQVADAENDRLLITTKGKLELVLADPTLLATLRDRWIDAEVAKRLDYPIFMAVSERGGKDNSGEYTHLMNDEGVVFGADGHPRVDQDLVNYDLEYEDLADAASIPDEKLCIAEAFVRFAQDQGFKFWEVT